MSQVFCNKAFLSPPKVYITAQKIAGRKKCLVEVVSLLQCITLQETLFWQIIWIMQCVFSVMLHFPTVTGMHDITGNSFGELIMFCNALHDRINCLRFNLQLFTPRWYTSPPQRPSFLGLSPDPEVTEQKSYGVYHVLAKQGKRLYTIGPERRVYTIEASDPEKEERRVSTVVVHTFVPCSVPVLEKRQFPLKKGGAKATQNGNHD